MPSRLKIIPNRYLCGDLECGYTAAMWRLLFAFLLVSCSQEGTGPCRLQLVADLPVTLDHNRVDVTGQVKGTDTPFIIDTGAERTLLTNSTATFMLLARSQLSSTRLVGVGGAITNADVYADVQLGKAEFGQRLAVADIPGTGGLIGGDMLSAYDVEFDLPDHRIRLWRAAGCSAADLPWHGPRATIPIQVTGGERLRVPVTINGKPVDALLDSGAAISLLQADTAQGLGVTQAALAADPSVLVHGVDGGTIRLRVHHFDALAVGDTKVDALKIGIDNNALQGTQMLLGVDYLLGRKVWVSYRTGKMFVQ
jgi:predicted aspartyl protease